MVPSRPAAAAAREAAAVARRHHRGADPADRQATGPRHGALDRGVRTDRDRAGRSANPCHGRARDPRGAGRVRAMAIHG